MDLRCEVCLNINRELDNKIATRGKILLFPNATTPTDYSLPALSCLKSQFKVAYCSSPNGVLPEEKFGFRKGRSTIRQLTRKSSDTSRCPKRQQWRSWTLKKPLVWFKLASVQFSSISQYISSIQYISVYRCHVFLMRSFVNRYFSTAHGKSFLIRDAWKNEDYFGTFECQSGIRRIDGLQPTGAKGRGQHIHFTWRSWRGSQDHQMGNSINE